MTAGGTSQEPNGPVVGEAATEAVEAQAAKAGASEAGEASTLPLSEPDPTSTMDPAAADPPPDEGLGAARMSETLVAEDAASADSDTVEVQNEKAPAAGTTQKPSGATSAEKGEAAVATQKDAAPTAATISPNASGLRTMLAEHPDQLETGLTVLCNEKGKPIGASYTTGVGDIDLLARDAQGSLVVVMVSETEEGEALVAEVLQRIGWVRKHVGRDKEKVRGIVLVERAPESLSYAAAAVADTVMLKTWRIALTFEDLEV